MRMTVFGVFVSSIMAGSVSCTRLNAPLASWKRSQLAMSRADDLMAPPAPIVVVSMGRCGEIRPVFQSY